MMLPATITPIEHSLRRSVQLHLLIGQFIFYGKRNDTIRL